MLTEDEYVAIARQKYQAIQALQNKTSFYDHEKTFETIWMDLGKQVLEKTISRTTRNRRKKKRITTRFGTISIATSHAYSKPSNGFTISPLLQDHLLVLAQQMPYTTAHEVAARLLGETVSRSSLYRLTREAGKAIEPALQAAPAPVLCPNKITYATADGLMLLMEEGYKETKLGRIFGADTLIASAVAGRGGHIDSSDYVGHVGSWLDFWAKWQIHLQAVVAQGSELVFLSDGVVWLHEQLQKSYPDAVMILDFYHAMEHLGSVAQAGIKQVSKRQDWLDMSAKLLLDSNLDHVIDRIRALPISSEISQRECAYIETNRQRMDYKLYRERGLLIGSGAIESANKSVVQSRLKREGQRWTKPGAQDVLNLRTCWMSGRWSIVETHLDPHRYAMAA